MIAYRSNPDILIPDDVIEYNLKANSDGYGATWRHPEDGLQYKKFGPADRDDFRSLADKLNRTGWPMTLHFRKATTGKPCYDLSHPFEYIDATGHRMVLQHNGIIQIRTKADESDTLAFIRVVLSGLGTGWWNNPSLLWLVEEAIGWSRILIQTEHDDVFINASEWNEVDGIMYSTTPLPGYSPKAVVPIYGVNSVQGLYGDVDPDYGRVDAEDDDVSWLHRGHDVVPISEVPDDGDDRYGECACLKCGTEGEFYWINGKLFIDIEHMTTQEDD